MTERDRVMCYLSERLAESYNARRMEQADGFNRLLTTIEYMTDDEYRGLEKDAQPA